MIKLILPIEPVAQAKPRARRFGKGIRLYDPPKTAVFKKQLRALATEMYHDAPVEGEIYLKVAFYRKIQKSISKKEHDRRALLLKAFPENSHWLGKRIYDWKACNRK